MRDPNVTFVSTSSGITADVLEEHRPSSYFVAIAPTKAKQAFKTEWTADRVEENRDINRIREQVGVWRQVGRLHITPTTRRLIDYWTDTERERRLSSLRLRPSTRSPIPRTPASPAVSHCYRRKPDPDVEETLAGDEAKEAKTREEEARVCQWR